MFYLILDTVSQDRLTKEIQLDIKIQGTMEMPENHSGTGMSGHEAFQRARVKSFSPDDSGVCQS